MAVRHAWQFAERTRAGAGDGIAAILGLLANPDLISFAGGFPDPRTFPADRMPARAQGLEASAFQYAPTHGLEGTRDAIAGRLERRPADDELLVTSGGIEALELVSKSFLDKGDTVVVEGPTYLGAIMVFRSFEADVRPVPIDADGLDVDDVLPGRPARLGDRAGRGGRAARLGEAEHRPVLGRARSAAVRGVCAPRLDRRAAARVARALRPEGGAAAGCPVGVHARRGL